MSVPSPAIRAKPISCSPSHALTVRGGASERAGQERRPPPRGVAQAGKRGQLDQRLSVHPSIDAQFDPAEAILRDGQPPFQFAHVVEGVIDDSPQDLCQRPGLSLAVGPGQRRVALPRLAEAFDRPGVRRTEVRAPGSPSRGTPS